MNPIKAIALAFLVAGLAAVIVAAKATSFGAAALFAGAALVCVFFAWAIATNGIRGG